jgi:hypothetical protein
MSSNMSSNARAQVEREEWEAHEAEIARRAKELERKERAKNKRISAWLRSKQTVPGKGVITGKMTHQQVNDQIRAAMGRGPKGS